MEWQALELTHVVHDPGDPLSVVFAFSALVPFCVLVGLATLFVAKREMVWGWALAGMVGNEAVNYVLKKTVQEPRPEESHRGGYGWPSSHAQFQAFFAAFVGLIVLHRWGMTRLSAGKLSILWAVAFTVSIGRVALHYHTQSQVMAGMAIGTTLGVLWFLLYKHVAVPFIFPLVEEHPIAKSLLLRDSSDIYTRGVDLGQREYELSRTLRGKKR
mmetsp:Transcript_1793/g.6407  ORF Transcript_1793/g.6407 Transcript_1793/m.6407 type:complete len:214 (-) Transcript_1793:158-799(-)